MNWEVIAERLGYSNFKAMFLSLYTIQGKNITEIATMLGCTVITIRRLIKINKLEYLIRSKGRAFGLTNPDVMSGSIAQAAAKTGLPKSTIWYRRKCARKIIKTMKDIDEAVTSLEAVPEALDDDT